MSLVNVKKRLESHKQEFKVYSKDNCSLCVKTKNEMNLAGVPFVEIKETLQFIKTIITPIIPRNHRTFPVVFVGDKGDENLDNFTYVSDWKTWKPEEK